MVREFVNQLETELKTGERELPPDLSEEELEEEEIEIEKEHNNFFVDGQITIRPEVRKFPNLSNYEDTLIKVIDKSK